MLGDVGFVGRSQELAALEQAMAACLRGQTVVRLVGGAAGMGKTTLVHEFLKRLEQKDGGSVRVARAQCSALTGYTDPYQPFRTMIDQLLVSPSERVDDDFKAGAKERLIRVARESGKMLLENAPDLMGSLIPGSSVLMSLGARVLEQEEWFQTLTAKLEQNDGDAAIASNAIADQVIQLVQRLSQDVPVLLFMDDLHWCDGASLSLLFRMQQQLHDSRLMILGTYRNDDPSRVGSAGNADTPLARLIAEQQNHDNNLITLGSERDAAKRAFVDVFLDAQENQLSNSFRDQLTMRTDANPLFLIEMLQALKDRRYLIQNSHGVWCEDADLNWVRMPGRVQEAILARLDTLDDSLRDLLSVAAVEGERTRSPVLARVFDVHERIIVQRLSRDLVRKHGYMLEGLVERVGNSWIAWFHFRSAVPQRVLYDELGKRERMLWHEAVADAVEACYEDSSDDVAAELAQHFAHAGRPRKALQYFKVAIRKSLYVSAHDVAGDMLEAALDMTDLLPSGEAAEHELDLQVLKSVLAKATTGWTSDEIKTAFQRIQTLAEQMGDRAEVSAALFGLWACHLGRLEIPESIRVGEACRAISERLGDTAGVMQAEMGIANSLYWRGDLIGARRHLDEAVTRLDPSACQEHTLKFGQDPRAFIALFEILLATRRGDLSTADRLIKESLVLFDEKEHLFSRALLLQGAAWACVQARRGTQALAYARDLVTLSKAHDFLFYIGVGEMFEGAALILEGDVTLGQALLQKGYDLQVNETQCWVFQSINDWFQAEALIARGAEKEARHAARDALMRMEKDGDLLYQAELLELVELT